MSGNRDDLTLIELELKRRAKREIDAKDFWIRYENMKSYLAAEYYPWIQASCPFFTDHGELHIHSVIQSVSLLLSRHLNLRSKKRELSSLDLFLILSGIIWHDVGNVYGRSGHADRVVEMTDKIKELAFPTPDIHRLVVEIAKAHHGRDGLNTPKLEEDCATRNRSYTVYPKALAAIVRFADEISENQSRISQALLSQVPNENRIFWEYANCVSASRPDPARERVVVTIAMQNDEAIEKFTCPQLPNRLNRTQKISLIEYVLCRLEKMNNERAYCAPQFSRYVSIQEIVARFTILRGTERVKNYDELEVVFGDSGLRRSSYPNIQIFDAFFDAYSAWKPEVLKEALQQ